MTFKQIKLQDMTIFHEFKNKSPKQNCDFCFTDLYLWSEYYHTELCISEDVLYLRYKIDGSFLYFMPLGNPKKGIQNLIEYTRERSEQLRIINIEKQDIEYFSCSIFSIEHKSNNDDYIYLASDLSYLQGKKYKSKRNFVNYFQENYTYEVKPISEFNEEEDLQFLDLWSKENPEEDRHSFLGEKEAILKAFHHIEDLNLDGIILKVNSKVIGLTLGTLEKDTFITHFEKVDYTYRGASQMINYLLANHVKDKVTYINREEDLGIEGLRIAKESYHPNYKVESYTAYYKKDFEKEINE